LHLRGEAGPAAVEYLRALVEAPQTVDWDGMANAEVAALPSIAATSMSSVPMRRAVVVTVRAHDSNTR
jgi:hypothetical protein